MGYADRVPNRDVMSEHQRVPRGIPILGSTDCHLAVLSLPGSGVPGLAGWRGSGLRRPAVGLAAHHHGPDDAGHPRPAPGQALLASATAATFFGLRASKAKSHGAVRPGLAARITAVAPITSSRRKSSSPARLIRPSFCRPAVESSRGVMPTQAAKRRPERKALASGTPAFARAGS